MPSTRHLVAGMGLCAAFAAPFVRGGVFDDPKNLKVLPKDISPRQLRETMRGFALDLGLRCENCHVGEAGQPPDTFDFAADDFTETPRLQFVDRLAAAGETAGAIGFLHQLHHEHGASFWTDLKLGELYFASGDRDRAVAFIEAARDAAPPALREGIQKRLGGLLEERAGTN